MDGLACVAMRRGLGLRLRLCRWSLLGTTIAPVGHELIELRTVLGKAQALQKLLELALLVLKTAQGLAAVIIKGAVAARRRGAPPGATATASCAVHPRLHAIHLRLPTARVVLPLSAVVMMPASHSSAPYEKGEDGEPNGPPRHEAEDRERDPGRLSEFIELVDEDHLGPPRCECK